MTAPVINNHGDVILFIHETLAKKDPISDRKAPKRFHICKALDGQ